jgi:transcriptional regulator with XRE-family HTH domain
MAGRETFAARLRAFRLQAGLTQAALGVQAGLPEDVASTRVNRYERGVHDCDLATAQALASVLGVPLASLFAADQREGELIRDMTLLSHTDQEQVRKLVSRLLPSKAIARASDH